MTENIEAIVLGYTKFGENSVVVHTLSEAYGRRGFLVRVGRKAGMALLLPLNILEMDIVPNPKSTLWSARNLTAKDPLNTSSRIRNPPCGRPGTSRRKTR